MKFSEWIENREQRVDEGWRDVLGAIASPFRWLRKKKNRAAVGDAVSSTAKALTPAGRRERLQKQQALKQARLAQPEEPVPVDDIAYAKAARWWDRLVAYAELGRQQLADKIFEPEASVLGRIKGDEEGDPMVLLAKRGLGWGASFIYKVLKFVLVKVVHLPAMYKFIRHDILKIGQDFGSAAGASIMDPGSREKWAKTGHESLNVLRVPVATVMMGIAMKLSYQQLMLIHHLGFIHIDLATVFKANAIVCYSLFAAFMIASLESDNAILKEVIKWMRQLFPDQMFQHGDDEEKKHESVRPKSFYKFCEEVEYDNRADAEMPRRGHVPDWESILAPLSLDDCLHVAYSAALSCLPHVQSGNREHAEELIHLIHTFMVDGTYDTCPECRRSGRIALQPGDPIDFAYACIGFAAFTMSGAENGEAEVKSYLDACLTYMHAAGLSSETLQIVRAFNSRSQKRRPEFAAGLDRFKSEDTTFHTLQIYLDELDEDGLIIVGKQGATLKLPNGPITVAGRTNDEIARRLISDPSLTWVIAMLKKMYS